MLRRLNKYKEVWYFGEKHPQRSAVGIYNTAVAFHKYDMLRNNVPGKPDLQHDKTKLLSSMVKGRRKTKEHTTPGGNK